MRLDFKEFRSTRGIFKKIPQSIFFNSGFRNIIFAHSHITQNAFSTMLIQNNEKKN